MTLEERQAVMRERLSRPKKRGHKLCGKGQQRHKRKLWRFQQRECQKRKRALQRDEQRLCMALISCVKERRKEKRDERREALQKIAAEKAQKKKVETFNALSKNARRGKSYEAVFAEGYAAGWKVHEEFVAGTTQKPEQMTTL